MKLKRSAQPLWRHRQEKGILTAAHRGTCGGNVIQNTCLAYETAILHGADMIEVDVILSTDGYFYAYHDGQERLVLNIDKDPRKMTSSEIGQYPCYNQVGLVTDQYLEQLDLILERFKGRCFINIDRTWFFWEEIITYLNKSDLLDQIILKSPVEPKLLEMLQELGPTIMYMPIVKTIEDWEVVKAYDINLVAAELIFETLDSPLIKPEFIEALKEDNILTWVNAITLDDTIVLSALLDDNNAIANGYDETWGKLVELGFDIIQTDWPGLLTGFLKQLNEGNSNEKGEL